MKKLSDKEIKKELLGMLSSLTTILEKNKIRYSIIAGTMLGAVRHGGFIPWDDDIDLIVPRNDYERLLSVVESNNELMKSFTSFELRNSIYPFLKFINKSIKIVDPVGIDKYLWIDIFPVDNIILQDVRHLKRQYWLFKAYQCKRASSYPALYKEQMVGRNLLKRIRNSIFIFGLKIIPTNLILNRFIKNAKKYMNKTNIKDATVLVWGSLEKEAFPSEFLEHYAQIQFEGIWVSIISNYKEWLSIRYGDYMKLPPIEDRVNHGIIAFVEDNLDVQ